MFLSTFYVPGILEALGTQQKTKQIKSWSLGTYILVWETDNKVSRYRV